MNDSTQANLYAAPQASLGVGIVDSRQYAGFWFRVLAAFIDGIIFTIISLVLLFAVGFGVAALLGSESFIDQFSEPDQGYSIIGFLYLFVSYVLPFILTVVLWVKYGGTPGKRLLGFKIIDEKTGQHLTAAKSIARYLCYVLSLLLLGLGCIWVAFDKKKKGLHDHMVGSIVVIE